MFIFEIDKSICSHLCQKWVELFRTPAPSHEEGGLRNSIEGIKFNIKTG